MSTLLNSVKSAISNMPLNGNRAAIWDKFVADSKYGVNMTRNFNHRLFEESLLCANETNLLSSMNMPDFFSINEVSRTGHISLDLTHMITKISNEEGEQESMLDSSLEIQIAKFSDKRFIIEANRDMDKSVESSQVFLANKRVDAIMTGNYSNCSVVNRESMEKKMAMEALCQRTDYKHLFCKAYLYLQDFLLSDLLGALEVRHAQYDKMILLKADLAQSMYYIQNFEVVVNSEHVSETEGAMLLLLGATYPSIKFGSEDNIYNTCGMLPDSVLMIENRDITRKYNYTISTATHFYETIVSLACKLNATSDLRDAFEMMRGQIPLARHLGKLHEVNVTTLGISKSHSHKYFLSCPLIEREKMMNPSNYFATTKSLVCDLLLGEMLKNGVYNVISALAFHGPAGCNSEDIVGDYMAKSMCSDYYLNSHMWDKNVLLQEYNIIKPTKYKMTPHINCGHYARVVAHNMTAKSTAGFSPGLLPLQHRTYMTNSLLHESRALDLGYLPKSFEIRGEASSSHQRNVRNFLWLHGVNRELPKSTVGQLGCPDQVRLTSLETSKLPLGYAKWKRALTVIKFLDYEPTSDINQYQETAWHSMWYQGVPAQIISEGDVVMDIKTGKPDKRSTTSTHKQSNIEQLKIDRTIPPIIPVKNTPSGAVPILSPRENKNTSNNNNKPSNIKLPKGMQEPLNSDQLLLSGSEAVNNLMISKSLDKYIVLSENMEAATLDAAPMSIKSKYKLSRNLTSEGYDGILDCVVGNLREANIIDKGTEWRTTINPSIAHIAENLDSNLIGMSIYDSDAGTISHYNTESAKHIVKIVRGSDYARYVTREGADFNLPGEVKVSHVNTHKTKPVKTQGYTQVKFKM